MPSIQCRMVSGLFKLIGVNKMLDKQGEEFEKLLESYRKKQKKPLKVPYGNTAQSCAKPKTVILYRHG